MKRLVLVLVGSLAAGAGALEAQHAQPAFRYVSPAEAIRLYWIDALAQFNAVRALAVHDADPPGTSSSARYDLLTVPQGAPVWDEFGEHPLVTEMRGRREALQRTEAHCPRAPGCAAAWTAGAVLGERWCQGEARSQDRRAATSGGTR